MNRYKAQKPGERNAVLIAARSYLQQGWNPLPLRPAAKNPTQADWQTTKTTYANVDSLFRNSRSNIGIRLGSASNGLCDLDVDAPEARLMAEDVLPKTKAVFGRKSARRSHYLYETDLHKTE